MAELLSIEHSTFSSGLQEQFSQEEKLTSVNVFDTFVEILSQQTNVLSKDKLKGLVFRQFKAYGDDDETMLAVAENVSDIKQSTQDALIAIDKQDTNALKNAYNQLKTYEERILKLEENIYTDDLTGIYNAKFLLNHELTRDGKFKEDGALLLLIINNFNDINKEHGHASGDSVLKFVSKIFEKNLNEIGVHLIRYLGVHFVAVAKESTSLKGTEIAQKTVDMILGKKFKTQSGEALKIEMELKTVKVTRAQDFQALYGEL